MTLVLRRSAIYFFTLLSILWIATPAFAAPEITVKGNNVVIANGENSPSVSNGTDFDIVNVSGSSSTTRYLILNSGTSRLNLSSTPKVQISGPNADDFSVSTQPAPCLPANAGTYLAITFNPSMGNERIATIEIDNNDSDEGTFTFTVQGTGYPYADTDGDSIPDISDNDADNDGLTNAQELALGTDRYVVDSDGDGSSDGQEVTDGSDPLDAGSVLPLLETSLCAEWNGFFNGSMWNILEHVNLSSHTRNVTTTLYDFSGTARGTQSFSVLPGAQRDVLVHDLPGWSVNSYGRVCSHVDGSEGDLDGRMVYYKPVGDSYDFAFAMPFSNGIAGQQFVLFNTYQPSLDPADAANFVANWIQITNQESNSQSGTLYYYAQDGSTLATDSVTIPANARRDFSGHQFGTNLVGMIKWAPNNSSAKFLMRNVRYLYDNPGSADSFASAFQLDGTKGSGEKLVAPLDTSIGSSILEVANTTNAQISVSVIVHDNNGGTLNSESFSLPAFGSRHLIMDSVLAGGLGSATVQGSATSSVIATAMHYGRTASAGIKYLYGLPAVQTLGATMRGSYNTYLGQGCDLLLINSSSSLKTASISMTREDGTAVFSGDQAIAGNGTVRFDLCSRDIANVYGTVTVQPSTSNTLAAHVIRLGASDAYRFVTPVRQ